ncbi:MAG: Mut7-C RNAse domain-containing protein [Halobacteriaceae archaeon]
MTPADTRIVCDAMLGRLATYLRMCGYDTVYVLEEDAEADEAVAAIARDTGRVLVTRDRALATRVDDAICLSSTDIDGQLNELVAAGVDLSLSTPTRCSRCNGRLERVTPDTSTPADEPDPGTTPVWACRACGQRYWQGSHWDDVADRLRELPMD